MSGKALNKVSEVPEVSEVTEVDLDSTMVDLSVDEDKALLSTKEVEVINVSSDSDEEDGIPYYTMQDIVSPKVGPATRRPGVKFMSHEQKVEYREKYGEDGDKLRRTVETHRVTKITRIAKVHYRPVKDQLAPVWRHRTEVYMGKLLQDDTEEIADQVTKIT